MPKEFKDPSRDEIRECFVRFVFGFGYEKVHLDTAIRKAYGDFSRTLHGISRIDASGSLREDATRFLYAEITKAASLKNQPDFDKWHEATCKALKARYAKGGFKDFHLGQAQKWVNMSIKYFTLLSALLGDRADPGSGSLFDFGHVPIDSLVLQVFSREHDLPGNYRPRDDRWSRIEDYGEYMAFQKWVRRTFPTSKPLAVEFHLWQVEMSRPKGGSIS